MEGSEAEFSEHQFLDKRLPDASIHIYSRLNVPSYGNAAEGSGRQCRFNGGEVLPVEYVRIHMRLSYGRLHTDSSSWHPGYLIFLDDHNAREQWTPPPHMAQGSGKVRYAAAFISLVLISIPFCIPGDRLRRVLYRKDQGGIICQAEDQYGSIALIRQWEEVQAETVVNLITDGFNMAGNSVDAKCYTYSAGLIPTLLHKDPEKVLVICVGLANTVNACTQMNLTREVDCVDSLEEGD